MIDQIIDTYIQLRDKKAQMKAQYEASIAPLDTMMEKAENHLRSKMQEQGVQSYKAAGGTAYIAERTSATVGDWEMIRPFIVENQLWSMLDRRVNKTAVDEYVAQNGDLPPGVNYRKELVVNIRRS